MYKSYYDPIPQPLMEGETTQLRISQKYLDVAGNREPLIDWAAISELVRLVESSTLPEWWKTEALGHLHDAANEGLPDYRRMQHFDHAGSRIWEGGTHFRKGVGYEKNLGQLMTLFQRAGGK